MIITKKKAIEEILASLNGKKSVYLFGCDSCAEQCSTGGEKELKEMTRLLEEAGIRVLGANLPAETCYRQLVLKAYREDENLKAAEAVLVLACGAGVRTVADVADESQPVLPTLDSHFLAATGGICPHTECPKSLLNGPCGGVADGMCEVNIECECAWVRIYRRLEKQGRLNLLMKIAEPKDHSVGIRPRKVLLREPARQADRKKKKGN